MIVSGILALSIPETLGRPLPQTLQEAEDIRRWTLNLGHEI